MPSSTLERLPVVRLGLIALAGMAIAVALSMSSWRALALGECLALLLVLLAPIGWALARGDGIAHPASFFSLIALGYPLSALFLLAGGQSITFGYRLHSGNTPYFLEAVSYALLGSICFYVGYWISMRPARDPQRGERFVPRPNRLAAAIIVLSVVGLGGYLFFVMSSGGVLHLIQNINRRGILRSTDYTRAIFQFLQVASWLWFCLDSRALRKPLFWIHGALVFAMLASTGSRTAIILHLLGFVVLSFLRSRRPQWSLARVVRSCILGAGIATLVLAVFLGFLAWRRAAVQSRGDGIKVADLVRSLEDFEDVETLAATFLGQGNAASIETLSTLVEHVPERIPHKSGESIYSLPLAPIPRSVWPEKPVNLGLQFNRAVIGPFTRTGRPISWIGELYWNFGVPGIVLGCLLFGFVCAQVHLWYTRNRHLPLASLIYTVYLVYFTTILTKVELKTAINRTVFYLLAIILSLYILGVSPVCFLRGRTASQSLPPTANNRRDG